VPNLSTSGDEGGGNHVTRHSHGDQSELVSCFAAAWIPDRAMVEAGVYPSFPDYTLNTAPDPGGIWVFTWGEIFGGVTQIVGLIAAFVFGVWAVKSFDAAEQANAIAAAGVNQAIIANKLALMSLCVSQPVSVLACRR
jgi:hypothetical protein